MRLTRHTFLLGVSVHITLFEGFFSQKMRENCTSLYYKKGSLIHIAPTCTGFEEGSDHFGFVLHITHSIVAI
jgi:hypothetical protein